MGWILKDCIYCR